MGLRRQFLINSLVFSSRPLSCYQVEVTLTPLHRFVNMKPKLYQYFGAFGAKNKNKNKKNKEFRAHRKWLCSFPLALQSILSCMLVSSRCFRSWRFTLSCFPALKSPKFSLTLDRKYRVECFYHAYMVGCSGVNLLNFRNLDQCETSEDMQL